MHSYRKVVFPALRERLFVRRHRARGHQVTHHSSARLSRCFWNCISCGERYWC
jgi:hypothetical protein